MRRSYVLALFVALAITSATADIGLVADLDGNYQNGPDTLEANPGDTVLVHVWITGEKDSLVGFGISLGDTLGALVWVEEEGESVYTTPSGWSNVRVPTNPAGWVLLQGQDFTHGVPLVLPSQVAEVEFAVAPGESCGTIGWDPKTSGWQTWVFPVGEFRSIDLPRVGERGVAPDIPESPGSPEPRESPEGPGPPKEPETPARPAVIPTVVDPSGRTVVPIDAWATFPIVATDCLGAGGQPAPGEYSLHLRQPPAESIRVSILDPAGYALETASPTLQNGRSYVTRSRDSACGYAVGHGSLACYPSYVWDDLTRTRIQSQLGDSVFVATFPFQDNFRPGNILSTRLGGEEVFREVVQDEITNIIRPVLPPPRPVSGEGLR